MFKRYLIIFINSLVWFVNEIILAIGFFMNYTMKLWKNNIMRKFVLKLMEKITHGFHCIKKYLEYVMDNITFRILYDRITLPMEIYYKDLKKRHG